MLPVWPMDMPSYAARRHYGLRWRPNTTDIASLQLYLRPDELLAGALSSWTDRSGGAHHAAQGTGANQPTVNVNRLNGYPTVQFDGSNDKLNTDLTTQFDAAATIIAVLKVNAALPTLDRGRILCSSGGGLGFAISGPDNDHKLRFVHTNVAWMDPSTSAVAIGSWGFVGATWDATANEAVYYINGVGSGTVTYTGNPAAGANVVRVGNEANSDAYAAALQFAEVLAFNAVLSGADRHRVEGYLAWKYGLESLLDSGHTYKNAAP